MKLELANLRLFVGTTLAVAVNAGCGTDLTIGDKLLGAGGNNGTQTGGAGNGKSTNTGGASLGGASGTGAPGTGGTSDNTTGCAGLEGQWTLTPTVLETSWDATQSSLPQPGNLTGPIGVVISEAAGGCSISWQPQWDRTSTAELESVGGTLAYAPTDEKAWITCLAKNWYQQRTWYLQRLVITPTATPTLQLTSRMQYLIDDVINSGTVTIRGTLSPGALERKIAGFGPLGAAPTWCFDSGIAVTPVPVFPWDILSVETSQSVTDLVNQLSTKIDVQSIASAWKAPDNPLDLNRLASTTMTPWDAVMGRTMRVSLGVDVTPWVDFTVSQLPLSDGFSGDTLAQLVTTGDRTLETLNGTNALHLTQSSCSLDVIASGLLRVTGRQQVVFSVQVNNPTGIQKIVAQVVSLDNTATLAQLTCPNGATTRTYTAALNGQDEVGVQLTASGGCQYLTLWNPDILVLGITAQ